MWFDLDIDRLPLAACAVGVVVVDKGGSREPKQEAGSDDALDKGEEMICEHT